MADLYPTPTRLALLAEVDDHAVHQNADGTSTANGGFRKVTAAITELQRAGWVELASEDLGPLRRWELTVTGRSILDRHQEGQDG